MQFGTYFHTSKKVQALVNVGLVLELQHDQSIIHLYDFPVTFLKYFMNSIIKLVTDEF